MVRVEEGVHKLVEADARVEAEGPQGDGDEDEEQAVVVAPDAVIQPLAVVVEADDALVAPARPRLGGSGQARAGGVRTIITRD